MKKILVALSLLCTTLTLTPAKHIGYFVSYLGILKQETRFDKRRAEECLRLNECAVVRKDWSKNKDKVTDAHWNVLKEREAIIKGDMLIAELEDIKKIRTAKMKPYEKKAHEKKLMLARYKVKHFLQNSLKEIIAKKLDEDVKRMKKKMRKLGVFIPRNL
jgi:hypothetical protein